MSKLFTIRYDGIERSLERKGNHGKIMEIELLDPYLISIFGRTILFLGDDPFLSAGFFSDLSQEEKKLLTEIYKKAIDVI